MLAWRVCQSPRCSAMAFSRLAAVSISPTSLVWACRAAASRVRAASAVWRAVSASSCRRCSSSFDKIVLPSSARSASASWRAPFPDLAVWSHLPLLPEGRHPPDARSDGRFFSAALFLAVAGGQKRAGCLHFCFCFFQCRAGLGQLFFQLPGFPGQLFQLFGVRRNRSEHLGGRAEPARPTVSWRLRADKGLSRQKVSSRRGPRRASSMTATLASACSMTFGPLTNWVSGSACFRRLRRLGRVKPAGQ